MAAAEKASEAAKLHAAVQEDLERAKAVAAEAQRASEKDKEKLRKALTS